MFRIILAISFSLCSVIMLAQFHAGFGFADVTPLSGTVDPGTLPQAEGIKLRSFNAVNVSANPTASGRFSFSNWPQGSINGSDDYSLMSGDLSGLKYYEVKVIVNSGYTLGVSSILFDVRRSSTGIRNFSIRSSQDNFTANLSAATGTNANLMVLPSDLFFWKYDSIGTSNDQKGCIVYPGMSHKNIADSVTFRFYAWNAENSNGSFSIDNVFISGNVKSETSGLHEISGHNNLQIRVYDLQGHLIIECMEESFPQEEKIQQGKVYLLQTDEGAFIKKVFVQ